MCLQNPVAPPAPQRSAEASRIWFAQAVRGTACGFIVAVHLGVLFPLAPSIPASMALFPPPAGVPAPAYVRVYSLLLSRHVSLGDTAVAMLFLTSGFVIPLSLTRYTLGGFFLRRFFRLYPTLWASQLLVLSVLAFQAHHYGLHFPFDRADVAANVLLLGNYLGKRPLEGVYWTLYIEELFYVIAALCAWGGVLKKPGAVLFIGLGLAAAAVAIYAAFPGPVQNRTGWRLGVFWLSCNAGYVVYVLIGVVLHQLYFGTWRLRLGVPLIGGLFGLYAVCAFQPLKRVWDPWTVCYAGAMALALFTTFLCLNRWLPYSRWLDRLADVSYPLYIVHFTIGSAVLNSSFVLTGSFYVSLAAASVCVLALAVVLHRFVERPSMAAGRRLAESLVREPAPSAELVRPESAERLPRSHAA